MLPDINGSRPGMQYQNTSPSSTPQAPMQQSKPQIPIMGMNATDMLVSLAPTGEPSYEKEEDTPLQEPVDYLGPLKSALHAYSPHQIPLPVQFVARFFLEALPTLLIVSTIIAAILTLGWFVFLFYVTYF